MLNRPPVCVSGRADWQGGLIEMRARWQAVRVEGVTAPSAARGGPLCLRYYLFRVTLFRLRWFHPDRQELHYAQGGY
jgi:hypothetical protein